MKKKTLLFLVILLTFIVSSVLVGEQLRQFFPRVDEVLVILAQEGSQTWVFITGANEILKSFFISMFFFVLLPKCTFVVGKFVYDAWTSNEFWSTLALIFVGPLFILGFIAWPLTSLYLLAIMSKEMSDWLMNRYEQKGIFA